MSQDRVRPGQRVRSTAGRDQGRYFIVTQRIDDRFVWVADGELRRLARPKRKNVRHLEIVDDGDAELTSRLLQNGPVRDSDLRRSLEAWNGKHEGDPDQWPRRTS